MKILQKISTAWVKKHPDELARIVEGLPREEAQQIVETMKSEEIASIINYMNPHNAADILEVIPQDKITASLENLSVKTIFLVFRQLDEEARERLNSSLAPTVLKQIRELSSYPSNSVGPLMDPQVTTLRKEQPVREVIRQIRKIYKAEPGALYYLYVTDQEHHLVGVVNIRDLLLADPGTIVEKIMNTELLTLRPEQDQEEVASLVEKYNYVAIPVVDAEHHLLGVVQHDDIIPVMEAEASDDIQKMFGAGSDERVFSSVRYSINKRLPWLWVNLGTAFIAAAVVSLFESTIARITVLAVMLPIVAGQSGNAGAQSLAVVIRGLALREIGQRMAWRVILKEWFIGLLNGIVIAITTGLIVFLWTKNVALAGVIALAMLIGLFVAGLAGAAIPLGLNALGRDPAQSSSILLTTITDVVGFLSFLGLAHLFSNLILAG